jgi:DNA recombination protein RmuC
MEGGTTMWVVAVATFVAGLAIGLILFFRGRAQSQSQREELKIKLTQLESERQADEEKLRWAETAEKQMSDAFKALAGEALKANSEQISNRSKSEFESLVKPLTDNLTSLDGYVRDLEKKREGAYGALGQQLQQLSDMHRSLQKETATLAQALKSPTVRGRWGEYQLRRLVEMAGMTGHVDFDEQQSAEGGGRPDMILHLPQGAILPIDSKVPLESYLDAMEEKDEQARNAKLSQHAKAMRGRVRELGLKAYWDQFERTPEVVVMFVPVEPSVGAAFQHDPKLFDYAMENKVLIASPVNLFALLKVFAYGWQQQRIAENAERIREEGQTLYKRVAKFVELFGKHGKQLDRSVDSYNEALGSLERRLIPTARRFEEMGVDTGELEPPKSVDTQPRLPTNSTEPD